MLEHHCCGICSSTQVKILRVRCNIVFVRNFRVQSRNHSLLVQYLAVAPLVRYHFRKVCSGMRHLDCRIILCTDSVLQCHRYNNHTRDAARYHQGNPAQSQAKNPEDDNSSTYILSQSTSLYYVKIWIRPDKEVKNVLATGTGVEQLHQLICVEVQKLLQVNSSVCKLPERPLPRLVSHAC